MSGRKSKVLLDSIDLEILEKLNPYSSNLGLGVIELTKKINLTHQNLKKHLEKLIKAHLIIPLTQSNTNKISLVTPYLYRDWDPADEEEDRKQREHIAEYNVILSYLRKINNLDYASETISNIAKEMKNGMNAPKPKSTTHKHKVKK